MKLKKLSFDNIGSLRKAEVTLRPLTVFTGVSNTGKSLLAWEIYQQFNKQKWRDAWISHEWRITMMPDSRDCEKSRYTNIEKIAQYIEENILEGKITRNDDNDFAYQMQNGKLLEDFDNCSMLVRNLTEIIIVIRYHLREGDLFIVEEPDLGMHLEDIRKIVAALTMLANAGITVLVTTKNDMFLEQLGNCVMKSKVGAEEESKIKEYHVGVYEFSKVKGGHSNCKKIPFGNSYGYCIDSNSQVSSDIYNEAARLIDILEN